MPCVRGLYALSQVIALAIGIAQFVGFIHYHQTPRNVPDVFNLPRGIMERHDDVACAKRILMPVLLEHSGSLGIKHQNRKVKTSPTL